MPGMCFALPAVFLFSVPIHYILVIFSRLAGGIFLFLKTEKIFSVFSFCPCF